MLVEIDVASLQGKTVGHRLAAGRDEQVSAADGFRAVFALGIDTDLAGVLPDFHGTVPVEDGDAFLAQGLGRDLCMRLVGAGEHAVHLYDRDLRAQPAEGLRHFHADRAAAEDDQM